MSMITDIALGDCVTVLFLMFLAYEQLNKKAL